MTSTYSYIYSCFLSKITDYKLLNIPEDNAYELMREWMHSAVSDPYVRRVFSSLTLDDEIETITFEIADTSGINTEDLDYGVELISRAMVIKWLEPQVKSTLMTAQMFTGKEQKFYSQSNHLNEIRTMLDNASKDLRKFIRDHGYFYRKYGDL